MATQPLTVQVIDPAGNYTGLSYRATTLAQARQKARQGVRLIGRYPGATPTGWTATVRQAGRLVATLEVSTDED